MSKTLREIGLQRIEPKLMKTSAEIIRYIVLPYLEQDVHFDNSKTTPEFWNHFASNIVQYDTDSKPLYKVIYSLGLDNAEILITILPKIYSQFINELAENYVLGNATESADYLITNKNATFSKNVTFFKTLQQAIKNIERKRIKEGFTKSFNRLSFELSEEDIANAAKKKAREDLKAKMKEWDKIENINDEKESETFLPKAASIPALVLFNKKIVLSKLLLIQWIKYSILTATVGVTGAILYKTKFEKQDLKINPIEVAVPIKVEKNTDTLSVKKNDSIIEEEADPKIVIDSSQTEKREEKKVKTVKHSGMNIKKDYKVLYNNIQPKINGLFNYLSNSQEENNKNKKYKVEYDRLLNQLNKYTLIGKSLTIYKEKQSNIGYILTDHFDNLYFYDGTNLYSIVKTETALQLNSIEDPAILEKLYIFIKFGT